MTISCPVSQPVSALIALGFWLSTGSNSTPSLMFGTAAPFVESDQSCDAAEESIEAAYSNAASFPPRL